MKYICVSKYRIFKTQKRNLVIEYLINEIKFVCEHNKINISGHNSEQIIKNILSCYNLIVYEHSHIIQSSLILPILEDTEYIYIKKNIDNFIDKFAHKLGDIVNDTNKNSNEKSSPYINLHDNVCLDKSNLNMNLKSNKRDPKTSEKICQENHDYHRLFNEPQIHARNKIKKITNYELIKKYLNNDIILYCKKDIKIIIDFIRYTLPDILLDDKNITTYQTLMNIVINYMESQTNSQDDKLFIEDIKILINIYKEKILDYEWAEKNYEQQINAIISDNYNNKLNVFKENKKLYLIIKETNNPPKSFKCMFCAYKTLDDNGWFGLNDKEQLEKFITEYRNECKKCNLQDRDNLFMLFLN